MKRPMPENVQRAIRETLLNAARFVEQEGNTHVVRAIWCVQGAPWKRAAACARYGDVVGHYATPRSAAETIDFCVAAALWED